jgi:hypothetical protein
VPGELLALLAIALYVEPRSGVLEKLRGAINHSHSIMKHYSRWNGCNKGVYF